MHWYDSWVSTSKRIYGDSSHYLVTKENMYNIYRRTHNHGGLGFQKIVKHVERRKLSRFYNSHLWINYQFLEPHTLI